MKVKSVCDSLRNCSHTKTEYPNAVSRHGTSPHLQWEKDAAVEGPAKAGVQGDVLKWYTFLLPGLPGHRGPHGRSKTKTHSQLLSFMGQTIFSIVCSCYPSSVDKASPEGRCHDVAMNTTQVGRVFSVHCSKKQFELTYEKSYSQCYQHAPRTNSECGSKG